MKRPWMPFYVGDYLAKTSHLTTEQHGAYLLLILHYWANGGLPQDENQLMAIAKMEAGKWYGNRVAIARFFDKDWRHSRIDEELAKAKNVSEKRALAGLKGAWSKHGKHVAEVWQMPPQSQSHIRKERMAGELTPQQRALAEMLAETVGKPLPQTPSSEVETPQASEKRDVASPELVKLLNTRGAA